MNYLNKILLFGTAASLLLMSGCQDLDFTNINELDRERALSSPEDLETLIKVIYVPSTKRAKAINPTLLFPFLPMS